MKRVLAVAVAALLVAVAIVVRDAIDDGNDGRRRAGDGGDLVVACVTELRDACEALAGVSELRVEDAADTVESTDVDAWVTYDPWPAMAEVDAGRPPVEGDVVAVGRTELVLLARSAALPGACGGEASWACVAEAAGSGAPALPPRTTALGILLLGHAAASWSAEVRPGEPFAANEFDLPDFDAWHRSLVFLRDPVADMIVFAPAGPVAAGTTAAVVETVVTPSREASRLDVATTVVPASVAVVVVGHGADRLAGQQAFLDALAELGYDAAEPTARTTGLPAPGVLVALQEIG